MRFFSIALRAIGLSSTLVLWPTAVLAEPPGLVVGQALSSAHQQLVNQGWSISKGALSTNPNHLEDQHLTAPLPSLITCSGTGQGLCAYGYSRKGKKLRLITQPNGSLLRWFDHQ